MWEKLPAPLQAKRISLSHLGVDEVAWLYNDLMSVLDFLEREKTPVLGGDVMTKRSGKYDFTYDNWSCNRMDGESSDAFSVRSIHHARAYLSGYPNVTDPDLSFTVTPA